MLASRRAQRMERHHKRGRASPINMVSLMDIFTILVFFLLVHSSDVESLPSTKSIKLPESVAEKEPKRTVVVTVSEQNILVQGRRVASVAEALNGADDTIEGLRAELEHQAKRMLNPGDKTPREITIMGDKEIPYRLLKKIMLTCARASYDNISLAVLKKQDKG